MHARLVEPTRITAADWKHARERLLPSLELTGGTHTEADLVAGVASGAYTLWLGDDSAILSQVINYPRLKAHRCFVAGGDLAELMLMEPEMAIDAKLLGCTRHEIDGRKGWERAMKPLGYGQAGIRLYRRI